MNAYDINDMKMRLSTLEARVRVLENFRFTCEDGARLADQVRDLKEAVAELEVDADLTPDEEEALKALESTDYEDDSPEAVAFIAGFLAAIE